jgi:hypothetical protein
MSTYYSPATSQLYAAYHADEVFADLDVSPGERIGEPPASRRRKLARRLGVAVVGISVLGGIHAADPALAPNAWSSFTSTAVPAIDRLMQAGVVPMTTAQMIMEWAEDGAVTTKRQLMSLLSEF